MFKMVYAIEATAHQKKYIVDIHWIMNQKLSKKNEQILLVLWKWVYLMYCSKLCIPLLC